MIKKPKSSEVVVPKKTEAGSSAGDAGPARPSVPLLISIGRTRAADGKWVTYRIKSQGSEILDYSIIESGSANVTAQALKIAVVREFMAVDPKATA